MCMVLTNCGRIDYLDGMQAVQEEIVVLEDEKRRVYEETKIITKLTGLRLRWTVVKPLSETLRAGV